MIYIGGHHKIRSQNVLCKEQGCLKYSLSENMAVELLFWRNHLPPV